MNEVILVLRGAIDGLSRNRTALSLVFLLSLVILLLMEVGVLPHAKGKVLVWSITFSYIAVYAFCMLSIFRILLINSKSVFPMGIDVISKSSIYFVLYIICLFIVLNSLSSFLFYSLPSTIAKSLFVALKVYLVARVILVFPAISVSSYFSFTSSWRRTKNTQRFMLIVSTVVVFLREVSKYVSEQLSSEMMVSILFFEMVFWVLIVAILAEAFKLVQLNYSVHGVR